MIGYLTDYKEREGGTPAATHDEDGFEMDAFDASNGPSFTSAVWAINITTALTIPHPYPFRHIMMR